jgi:sulfite exporter TauE/SafE
VSTEIGFALVFTTGLFGAFHCLGMCSGIAAGFFVYHGWEPRFLPQIHYHGARIFVYAALGTLGALLGRVLVQTGMTGKGQGLLMVTAGVLISLLGVRVAGLLPWKPSPELRRGQAQAVQIGLPESGRPPRRWTPLVAGLVNGLVPCSLVFSVAVKAVATADPIRAGALMAAFGLGTLPTMAAVSTLGGVVGTRARGLAARLAGFSVIALGLWTLYEGLVFYDIMRGLSNW